MTKLTVALRNSANARNYFMTLKCNYMKDLYKNEIDADLGFM